MTLLTRVFLAVSLIISDAISAADAEESCSGLRQITSAAMETMADGLVYVPVVIKDHSLNFLLQTEARGSLISASAVATLALPREPISRWNVHLQGDRLRDFATAEALKLGGWTAKVRFAVGPDGDFKPGLSGILGADFLRNFDVEFDFAKSRVNLFSPDHCQGGVVYWTQSGASRVPMQMNDWGEITVDAEVEGKSVRAEIGTGLPKSYLMMAQGNTKFGVPDKEWKLVKAGTYHATWSSAAIYEHVFKSLTLNGIEIDNADLTIASGGPVNLGARLFLGMDILRQLHLYVAYKERNLYASTAGATAAPPAQQPTPSTSPALQQPPSTPPAH